MPFETPRLILRELTEDDFGSWYGILSDPETMRFYPAPFDEDKVRRWIRWSQDNYARYGFGLWAVILKETGEFIGDCGITMQSIHGQQLPEVGYHIHRDYRRRGYASEAAALCIRLAFDRWRFPAVYSYMKHTNEPSFRTAMRNGMRFIEEYDDPVNTKTRVYAITREEWEHRCKA